MKRTHKKALIISGGAIVFSLMLHKGTRKVSKRYDTFCSSFKKLISFGLSSFREYSFFRFKSEKKVEKDASDFSKYVFSLGGAYVKLCQYFGARGGGLPINYVNHFRENLGRTVKTKEEIEKLILVKLESFFRDDPYNYVYFSKKRNPSKGVLLEMTMKKEETATRRLRKLVDYYKVGEGILSAKDVVNKQEREDSSMAIKIKPTHDEASIGITMFVEGKSQKVGEKDLCCFKIVRRDVSEMIAYDMRFLRGFIKTGGFLFGYKIFEVLPFFGKVAQCFSFLSLVIDEVHKNIRTEIDLENEFENMMKQFVRLYDKRIVDKLRKLQIDSFSKYEYKRLVKDINKLEKGNKFSVKIPLPLSCSTSRDALLMQCVPSRRTLKDMIDENAFNDDEKADIIFHLSEFFARNLILNNFTQADFHTKNIMVHKGQKKTDLYVIDFGLCFEWGRDSQKDKKDFFLFFMKLFENFDFKNSRIRETKESKDILYNFMAQEMGIVPDEGPEVIIDNLQKFIFSEGTSVFPKMKKIRSCYIYPFANIQMLTGMYSQFFQNSRKDPERVRNLRKLTILFPFALYSYFELNQPKNNQPGKIHFQKRERQTLRMIKQLKRIYDHSSQLIDSFKIFDQYPVQVQKSSFQFTNVYDFVIYIAFCNYKNVDKSPLLKNLILSSINFVLKDFSNFGIFKYIQIHNLQKENAVYYKNGSFKISENGDISLQVFLPKNVCDISLNNKNYLINISELEWGETYVRLERKKNAKHFSITPVKESSELFRVGEIGFTVKRGEEEKSYRFHKIDCKTIYEQLVKNIDWKLDVRNNRFTVQEKKSTRETFEHEKHFKVIILNSILQYYNAEFKQDVVNTFVRSLFQKFFDQKMITQFKVKVIKKGQRLTKSKSTIEIRVGSIMEKQVVLNVKGSVRLDLQINFIKNPIKDLNIFIDCNMGMRKAPKDYGIFKLDVLKLTHLDVKVKDMIFLAKLIKKSFMNILERGNSIEFDIIRSKMFVNETDLFQSVLEEYFPKYIVIKNVFKQLFKNTCSVDFKKDSITLGICPKTNQLLLSVKNLNIEGGYNPFKGKNGKFELELDKNSCGVRVFGESIRSLKLTIIDLSFDMRIMKNGVFLFEKKGVNFGKTIECFYDLDSGRIQDTHHTDVNAVSVYEFFNILFIKQINHSPDNFFWGELMEKQFVSNVLSCISFSDNESMIRLRNFNVTKVDLVSDKTLQIVVRNTPRAQLVITRLPLKVVEKGKKESSNLSYTLSAEDCEFRFILKLIWREGKTFCKIMNLSGILLKRIIPKIGDFELPYDLTVHEGTLKEIRVQKSVLSHIFPKEGFFFELIKQYMNQKKFTHDIDKIQDEIRFLKVNNLVCNSQKIVKNIILFTGNEDVFIPLGFKHLNCKDVSVSIVDDDILKFNVDLKKLGLICSAKFLGKEIKIKRFSGDKVNFLFDVLRNELIDCNNEFNLFDYFTPLLLFPNYWEIIDWNYFFKNKLFMKELTNRIYMVSNFNESEGLMIKKIFSSNSRNGKELTIEFENLFSHKIGEKVKEREKSTKIPFLNTGFSFSTQFEIQSVKIKNYQKKYNEQKPVLEVEIQLKNFKLSGANKIAEKYITDMFKKRKGAIVLTGQIHIIENRIHTILLKESFGLVKKARVYTKYFGRIAHMIGCNIQ